MKESGMKEISPKNLQISDLWGSDWYWDKTAPATHPTDSALIGGDYIFNHSSSQDWMVGIRAL